MVYDGVQEVSANGQPKWPDTAFRQLPDLTHAQISTL